MTETTVAPDRLEDLSSEYEELEYADINVVGPNGYYIVYLNGFKLDIATMANKSEGWVECLVMNTGNKPIIVKGKNGELEAAHCVIRGDVVIVALNCDGSIKFKDK